MNVAYERKLSEVFDAVVELNYRHAQRDEVDGSGETDPNTGGSILYVTPRLMVAVAPRVVLRVSAQVPVVKSLYGVQREKTNVNAGVTFLFRARLSRGASRSRRASPRCRARSAPSAP